VTSFRRNPGHGGFTLVEVLVALAIIAIALGALIRAGADAAANASYLRDKTFAHWVALNLIAEQQLRPDWPPVGLSDGTAQFAGRDWPWQQEVEATGDGDIRRLIVGVERPGIAGAVVRLVAYLPRRGAGGTRP
jgi:general secretion pathway protein I